MAGCFIIGELPEELRIIGNHDVPDPVIMSCLSQMQLTDHCYGISTSWVTSRAANDRSSPHSCVRAGQFPRHEHGPPVPGDRDFRQEADSLFSNAVLATELQELKKMLRIMGETKEELRGSLNGPGSFKKRNAHADEEDDCGKLFSEWRLVGRTLRPIDNNVVAGGDSFKPSTVISQNIKGENQFLEPFVAYPANENSKGDHPQFYEPLVPYATNEPSEPATKASQGGDSYKSAASLNPAITKKVFGPPVTTELLPDSAKSVVVGDSMKPLSSLVSHQNKVNPANEIPHSITKPCKVEERPKNTDTCHVHSIDASPSVACVTSQTRKESPNLIEERATVLRVTRGSASGEEDTSSSDSATSSFDSLTDLDSASDLEVKEVDQKTVSRDKSSADWMNRDKSPETLREERILEAAIKAGASYFHDGVVYRENLIYDMLRSPSSEKQEDILESNHDLEEFQKPVPRKKSYNPELFSLSNDHFLEAFERTLAELDPRDTIDQETFASVTRHSAEPEPVFHEFNFASLAKFRIEDETLLDLNSSTSNLPDPIATTATTDRDASGLLAKLDGPIHVPAYSVDEVNQFSLEEEALCDGAEGFLLKDKALREKADQFFLEGKEVRQFLLDEELARGGAAEETSQFVLEEEALREEDQSKISALAPATPDPVVEVKSTNLKEKRDATSGRAIELNQMKIARESNLLITSAIAHTNSVAGDEEQVTVGVAPSRDECGLAPPKTEAGAVRLIVSYDVHEGTADIYQEQLKQRRSAEQAGRGARSSAAILAPVNHRSNLSRPGSFSLAELNEGHFAADTDRGFAGHLEPLNDRSNFPTENADDLNQRTRPRPKTITDFFNPSEMTLRRPSTIEPRKKDKQEIKSNLRTSVVADCPADIRFALPPPSSRTSSRRHSLSEKSLEIAGLALTPIKVPSRERVCSIHGMWDQTSGSCTLCSQAARRRGGESRVFGAAGSKSPQLESATLRRSGDAASPFGTPSSQSPYKVHTGFLKKGGGGSPAGTAAGAKAPQTPQSTTSSGSEASPKDNPFKRNTGIYSSLVPREKKNGDGSSVLFNTSRLSTSMNLPPSSRMSTSVNLPSASERSSNQRQSSSRPSTETTQSFGSHKQSSPQDIKKASNLSTSKPSFSTPTTVGRSRTISTPATKEKLTLGAARRTQSVKERSTR